MATERALPDFLIIGAAKAGTTALWRALSRHPGVFMPALKEPSFFSYEADALDFSCPGGKAYAKSIVTRASDYRALFPDHAHRLVTGEASPAYLSVAGSAEVAHRYVPGAKLIAILRHPVERAFSQYLHLRHDGLEPLSDFREAVASEEHRRQLGWLVRFHYCERGYYGRQLDRWLEYYSREQLLVLFYEDWRDHPDTVLQQIYRHIGVQPVPHLRVTRENVSSREPRWTWLHRNMMGDNALRRWAQRRLPLWARDAITRSLGRVNLKPGPTLAPEVRSALAARYDDDVRHVEELTGRDLSHWRR